jgi:hypothetical protein
MPFTNPFSVLKINLNINPTGKPGGDLNLKNNRALDCFLTQNEAQQELQEYDRKLPLTGVPTIEKAYNHASQCQAQ